MTIVQFGYFRLAVMGGLVISVKPAQVIPTTDHVFDENPITGVMLKMVSQAAHLNPRLVGRLFYSVRPKRVMLMIGQVACLSRVVIGGLVISVRPMGKAFISGQAVHIKLSIHCGLIFSIRARMVIGQVARCSSILSWGLIFSVRPADVVLLIDHVTDITSCITLGVAYFIRPTFVMALVGQVGDFSLFSTFRLVDFVRPAKKSVMIGDVRRSTFFSETLAHSVRPTFRALFGQFADSGLFRIFGLACCVRAAGERFVIGDIDCTRHTFLSGALTDSIRPTHVRLTASMMERSHAEL